MAHFLDARFSIADPRKKGSHKYFNLPNFPYKEVENDIKSYRRKQRVKSITSKQQKQIENAEQKSFEQLTFEQWMEEKCTTQQLQKATDEQIADLKHKLKSTKADLKE